MIAAWYRERDYHFLALTDHNVLAEGDRWMQVSKVIQRSDEGILGRYRSRFGNTWVETRTDPKKGEQVRLKPMHEFRYLLEEAGKFILISAEEISDKANGKPIHINGTNLAEAIEPLGGENVLQTIENNLRAILDQGRRHGREVLPHVNHPNFHYAITPEELARITLNGSSRFTTGIPESIIWVTRTIPRLNECGILQTRFVVRRSKWNRLWESRRTTLMNTMVCLDHVPDVVG